MEAWTEGKRNEGMKDGKSRSWKNGETERQRDNEMKGQKKKEMKRWWAGGTKEGRDGKSEKRGSKIIKCTAKGCREWVKKWRNGETEQQMNGKPKKQSDRKIKGRMNGAPDVQLKDKTEFWKNGVSEGWRNRSIIGRSGESTMSWH